MTRRYGRSAQHGVSLVEALVAMAVMGFGMLAIVGVQSTLRFNADMSKQRAEATRLAEQELEFVRAFSDVGSGGTTEKEFEAIATTPETTISGPEWNATFRRTRTVIDAPDGISKMISIAVQWDDRTGVTRTVSMYDLITRVDPMLSGFVKGERPLTAIGRRNGRHPTIPTAAQELPGDSGKSIFLPPNAGGRAWVFNNWTGAITHVCTGVGGYDAVNASTLSSNCTSQSPAGQLVSGLIRFNLRGAAHDLGSFSVLKPAAGGDVAWVIDHGVTPALSRICPVPAASSSTTLTAVDVVSGCTTASFPITPFAPADLTHALDANDSEDPRWPTLPAGVVLDMTASPHRSGISSFECFADFNDSRFGPALASPAPYAIQYFCIVIPTSTAGWGGRTVVQPLPYADGNEAVWTIGSTMGAYRICRYTQASSAYTDNDDHPAFYGVDAATCASTCRPVQGNLVNQNFLVINGTKSCPTDAGANPAAGNFINSNTLPHQP